ncbi:MAG: cysteine-rich KTR domain-containing protein [Filifactoraceae bacterium]
MLLVEWIRCPVCDNKTRLKIIEDTVLKNFPLFCPKCKQETVINAKQFNFSLYILRWYVTSLL